MWCNVIDNSNVVETQGFSSPSSEAVYRTKWPDEVPTRELYEAGRQCGACAYFAKLNGDWGLCAHAKSRHHLETVFEHFTCPVQVNEGWDSHSFCEARPDGR